MAFHAGGGGGGNTSCGRGMRNYHSTNSGLIGTEVNFVEFQVNIPKGSMIP